MATIEMKSAIDLAMKNDVSFTIEPVMGQDGKSYPIKGMILMQNGYSKDRPAVYVMWMNGDKAYKHKAKKQADGTMKVTGRHKNLDFLVSRAAADGGDRIMIADHDTETGFRSFQGDSFERPFTLKGLQDAIDVVKKLDDRVPEKEEKSSKKGNGGSSEFDLKIKKIDSAEKVYESMKETYGPRSKEAKDALAKWNALTD